MKGILSLKKLAIVVILCLWGGAVFMFEGCVNGDDSDITHTHTFDFIDEKIATCKDKGNKMYYKCFSCGKIFEDMYGTKEITDETSVEIPIDPSNHDYGTDGKCKRCYKSALTIVTIDGIIYTYIKADGENIGYYEVNGISDEKITEANIKSEISGIPVKAINIKLNVSKRSLSLESIKVPNSVTNIVIFCGDLKDISENLACIVVDSDNPNYSSQDGILYNKDKTELICVPKAVNRIVNIPESVITIDDYAFSDCKNLTTITIPDSVTIIDDCAFSRCTSLTSITIPNSVTSIGTSAFNGCTGLASITIPNSVTSIGNSVFYDCNNLETLYWNARACASTDSRIFSGCDKLITVVIGDSVTSIPPHAFDNCINLTVDSDNPNYSSQDGILYNKDKTELICALKAINRIVNIPESVIVIDDYAFSNCKNLSSITIPDSVTSIGTSAFSSCTGLTSVTIPNSITNIGDFEFSSCTGLTSIIIPDSVTSIGTSAFSSCTGLTSITIPNSVTSIGTSAFNGCTGLTNITIPDSVTSIGENAFRGCTNLRNITIPDSVRYIGYNVFKGCSGLKSVTIGNGITSIGNGWFRDCGNLTSITLPFVGESKTGTNNTHFGYIFGASTYSENGDYVPKSLKYVIITGGNSIGDNAFIGCKNITNITIPASVTYIGDKAFGYSGSYTGFSSITYTGELRGWCAIKGLRSLMQYTASNKTLTIGKEKITSDLVIPDGVIRIEDYAFYHYFSGLTSITLPASLEYIGAWSFCKCTGVSTIDFKGTQNQWKTMTRGFEWDNKAGDGYGFYKVSCIDGMLVNTNIVN